METCPALGLGYAPDLLALLDCKADLLARSGFGALAMPGSPAMVMVAGMMTLLVALYGYRLILGGRADFGDIMVSVVKIGLVLAFATQWPAYQTVFYDVATKGPQELLARLPTELVDDPGQYPARLQASYDRLAALETPQRIVGVSASNTVPSSDPYAAAQLPPAIDLTYGDFLAFRPMSAGLFLLFPALVALALPRLVAALLLALGPLFIGFLLFDATRSIFLGWLRMLAWSIVAGTIATAIIGIELSIVEPQIIALIADLAPGQSALPQMGELIATAFLFACLLTGGLVAAVAPTRLARLSVRLFPARYGDDKRSHRTGRDNGNALIQHPEPAILRSRAQLIGDRMALAAQADSRVRQLTIADGASRMPERIAQQRRSETATPLGQSYRRNGPSRRMVNPARRDIKK